MVTSEASSELLAVGRNLECEGIDLDCHEHVKTSRKYVNEERIHQNYRNECLKMLENFGPILKTYLFDDNRKRSEMFSFEEKLDNTN
mmetsp:Transcript_3697/g.5786  ORF Transcript_3697/g.5786 Transcript_3697/m.5786 type:complete len:87 (+) Transcript_3697:1668-1928(+)